MNTTLWSGHWNWAAARKLKGCGSDPLTERNQHIRAPYPSDFPETCLHCPEAYHAFQRPRLALSKTHAALVVSASMKFALAHALPFYQYAFRKQLAFTQASGNVISCTKYRALIFRT